MLDHDSRDLCGEKLLSCRWHVCWSWKAQGRGATGPVCAWGADAASTATCISFFSPKHSNHDKIRDAHNSSDTVHHDIYHDDDDDDDENENYTTNYYYNYGIIRSSSQQ